MISTLILAQAAPTTVTPWLESFFWLVAGVGGVLGCMVALKSLREKPEATPQPFKVEAAEKFVSHVEFIELKADVEQIRQDVQSGFRTLGDERRTSVGNLHSKIDNTNEAVHEMRGEVKHLNQQVQQLVQLQLQRNNQPAAPR
jgi:TolA-binding protein